MELRMKNWEYKKLGDVCRVINGRAYSDEEFLDKGKYRVLRVGNFFTNNNWYYSDLELDEDKYCEEGDLLYAWSASFGPKIWRGEKVIYHYHIWKLEPSLNVDKFYLFWWLQSDNMINQFSSDLHGATMHHITKGLMESLNVPLPPLEEQKRIVKILDEKFAMLETVKANAKANLQNAKDLFQSQLTKAFSNTTWEKKRIDAISENHDSERIPITKNVRTSGDYPYYGASGIVDYVADYIFDGKYLLVSEDGANLLARTYPIAFVAEGKFWVNNHAHILKFDNDTTMKFVELYFSQLDLSEYVTGMAQPKFNQTSLNKLEIPLPPLSEQRRIVEQLDSLSEKVRSLEEIYTKQLANCDELKQAFLSKAFNGEL